MSEGARDPRFDVDAVEVESSGRSDSFDGNHTDRTVSWLVLPPGRRIGEGDMEVLLSWLIEGHLAWFVFPTNLDDG